MRAAMNPAAQADTTQADSGLLAFFISDLHLQASHPRTTHAFLDFLRMRAPAARALYLLGDIFDAWPGDDDLASPYHAPIVAALRALSASGVALYWMAGNRDFLVGEGFAQATGATLLPDPFVLEAGGRRLILSHGDAACTDDLKYMEFRAMVREPHWQKQFLARPLAERKAIAAGLRDASRAQQREKSMSIMDVNPAAIAALYASCAADTLIHGHTHRPAVHRDGAAVRLVLPDWDYEDEGQPRGGFVTLDAAGHLQRHDAAGAPLGPAC